jgi:uncharacterized protein
MRFGLTKGQLEEITGIISRFEEVEEIIIFGSRATAKNSTSSDIDIALKGELVSDKIKDEICMQLEDSYLPYLIDIVIYNEIKNENLKEQIDKNGKTLYTKQ